MKSVKWILFSILLMLIHVNVSSQNNELGVVVGSFNGFSYKRIVSNSFATLSEIGFPFYKSPCLIQDGDLNKVANGTMSLWGFELDQNFLFNRQFENQWTFFVGGGVSVGMVVDYYTYDVFAKTGVNAIVGCEYAFSNVPLGISLDFRPGYGTMYFPENVLLVSLFDWKLALSLRYCF